MSTGDDPAPTGGGWPKAWHGVHKALDDPLRIRPGRVLYLPNPGELAEED